MKKKKGYIVITMDEVDIDKVQTCPSFKPPKNVRYKEISECYDFDSALIDIRASLKNNGNVIVLRDYID